MAAEALAALNHNKSSDVGNLSHITSKPGIVL